MSAWLHRIFGLCVVLPLGAACSAGADGSTAVVPSCDREAGACASPTAGTWTLACAEPPKTTTVDGLQVEYLVFEAEGTGSVEEGVGGLTVEMELVFHSTVREWVTRETFEAWGGYETCEDASMEPILGGGCERTYEESEDWSRTYVPIEGGLWESFFPSGEPRPGGGYRACEDGGTQEWTLEHDAGSPRFLAFVAE